MLQSSILSHPFKTSTEPECCPCITLEWWFAINSCDVINKYRGSIMPDIAFFFVCYTCVYDKKKRDKINFCDLY